MVRAAALFVSVFGAVLAGAAIWHPDSPLPERWNPAVPLVIADTLTPLTRWKLRRTAADGAACAAALGIARDPPVITAGGACGIADPVTIRRVGGARLGDVQTACATALRLAMWERHGLQPAAERYLGARIARLHDSGSYNCRTIRTSRGPSARMSTHATGSAIDITGVDLEDGRRIMLQADWNGDPARAAFLRAARDTACRWFTTVLGPDYNALHADHFHLQSARAGPCR